MTCPYLDYRESDEDHEFETARPYCTVAEAFVSPMKADICNDRHEFAHDRDCELFPDESAEEAEAVAGETVRADPSE